jgi:hypothetical protein
MHPAHSSCGTAVFIIVAVCLFLFALPAKRV